MAKFSDYLGGSFGKLSPEREDPHKNNPEPIRGGCGDPNCRLCYNENGQLNSESGKFQGAVSDSNSGGNLADILSAAIQNLEANNVRYTGPLDPTSPGTSSARNFNEALQAARELVGKRGLTLDNAMGVIDRVYGRNTASAIYAILKAERGTAVPVKDRRALDKAREPVEQYLISMSTGVAWDEVIGNDAAKVALRDAIEASTTNADLYNFYEMKMPKGVMLWGPPGCGKTMLGKASATALGKVYGKDTTEIMLINGPELESPIVGIAADKVRKVFAYAREYHAYHGHPLVIFMDEVDSLLADRNSAPWTSEIVGQFLSEMDGLAVNGAFVIMATNRPDTLDEALLRDGRIDRKIKVERPTIESAREIARQAMEGKPWLQTQSLDFVDRLYDPFLYLLREMVNPETKAHHHFTLGHIVSGAMVAGLVSRAKTIAFQRDKASGEMSGVTEDDLFAAVEQVFNENKGLKHQYAMMEFVQDVALPAEAAREQLRGLN